METILVVDDDAETREIAAGCLREHGLTPLFAENGIQALAVVEDRHPDAVLTDLNMPEMDGLELVRRMRRDHSTIPVVLMTATGTEQSAVAALRAGALSYVPKKDMRTNLCEAMGVVMAAVAARRYRERARTLLEKSESSFVLGYEPDAIDAVISHFQSNLARFEFCDETGLFQVTAALNEALHNAIEHGNLEIDSSLREKSNAEYSGLFRQRMETPPYRERRVRVAERLLPAEVTYVISDEGPGFDTSCVPSPTDAENLLKCSGRGLMLMRTFMDEVTFNRAGNKVTMLKRRQVG
jgi:CheY-like chemotaxis protein/anti-sigma regulatory factor (Ser/Thr protein kinase)